MVIFADRQAQFDKVVQPTPSDSPSGPQPVNPQVTDPQSFPALPDSQGGLGSFVAGTGIRALDNISASLGITKPDEIQNALTDPSGHLRAFMKANQGPLDITSGIVIALAEGWGVGKLVGMTGQVASRFLGGTALGGKLARFTVSEARVTRHLEQTTTVAYANNLDGAAFKVFARQGVGVKGASVAKLSGALKNIGRGRGLAFGMGSEGLLYATQNANQSFYPTDSTASNLALGALGIILPVGLESIASSGAVKRIIADDARSKVLAHAIEEAGQGVVKDVPLPEIWATELTRIETLNAKKLAKTKIPKAGLPLTIDEKINHAMPALARMTKKADSTLVDSHMALLKEERLSLISSGSGVVTDQAAQELLQGSAQMQTASDRKLAVASRTTIQRVSDSHISRAVDLLEVMTSRGTPGTANSAFALRAVKGFQGSNAAGEALKAYVLKNPVSPYGMEFAGMIPNDTNPIRMMNAHKLIISQAIEKSGKILKDSKATELEKDAAQKVLDRARWEEVHLEHLVLFNGEILPVYEFSNLDLATNLQAKQDLRSKDLILVDNSGVSMTKDGRIFRGRGKSLTDMNPQGKRDFQDAQAIYTGLEHMAQIGAKDESFKFFLPLKAEIGRAHV